MGIVFQAVCALFIVAAVIVFVVQSRSARAGSSKAQIVLAVFQVALCGWFFGLCVSDILDVNVGFSYVRFVLNIFYALAFLMVTVYTFILRSRLKDRYFTYVIWSYIALIAMQCFVFPYGTEIEILRIVEALEGAAVFGLLIALLLRREDAAFCKKALVTAVVLELFIAVENTILPFSAIINDIDIMDIPLNYASLYMRPVLFATLALIYQVRLDRKSAEDNKKTDDKNP